jgi:hypothetical protein
MAHYILNADEFESKFVRVEEEREYKRQQMYEEETKVKQKDFDDRVDEYRALICGAIVPDNFERSIIHDNYCIMKATLHIDPAHRLQVANLVDTTLKELSGKRSKYFLYECSYDIETKSFDMSIAWSRKPSRGTVTTVN